MGYTNENVQFDHITTEVVGGTGWLDRFLTTTRANLADALRKNEIDAEGVGTVLAGVIPGMTQQAVDFELRKDLVALNIDIEEQKLALLAQEFEIKEREITETERMGQTKRNVMEREMRDKELNSAKSRELQERDTVNTELTGIASRSVIDQQEDKLANDNRAWSDALKVLTDDQRLIRYKANVQEEEAAKVRQQTTLVVLEQSKTTASTGEIERKTQFYDDKLLIDTMTKQADLASFAVNANSDSAQNTINDLKVKMATTEARVSPIGTPPPAGTEPGVVTNLTVSNATDTTLTISWTFDPNGASYRVYRDGALRGDIPGTSFTDVTLMPGTKYAYTIVTVSSTGVTSQHSYARVGTTTGDSCPAAPAPVPTVPSINTGTVTANSIAFTWGAITGATSYLVYQDGNLLATVASPSTTSSGLMADTKYSYSIKTVTSTATSGYSVSFIVPTTP